MKMLDTKTSNDNRYGYHEQTSYEQAAQATPTGYSPTRELQEKEKQLQQWEDHIRKQQKELLEQKRQMEQEFAESSAKRKMEQGNAEASYPSTPSNNNNNNNMNSMAATKTSGEFKEQPSQPQAIVTPAIKKQSIVTPSVTLPQSISDAMAPEAAVLFRKNRASLQSLYDTYASGSSVDGAEGVYGISLESFAGMCSDFDLFPTFLNKEGIVTCFERASNNGSVNFEEFTNALYEVALYSLSKSTFQELYPTAESKVNVMLNLWGLADTQRLAVINSRRN